MFKQLLLDDSTAIVTFVAFVVAATIFITFVWRAIRMNRGQVQRFENLPFDVETPVAVRVTATTMEQHNESRSIKRLPR